MGWQKEHHEHPWATKAQAKRIAHDHTAKKKHSCHSHAQAGPVQAARVDVAKNMQWSKKIAHKKVI